jgi:serine/threonine protein kinase
MSSAQLPERIGRYDVVRLLGQGGMGRVLLAKDSVLGRSVAIKILRDDLGLPPESKAALFARMRQEARAAAALEHPHMITLHDMGDEAPHGLFLVFEYVDGPTLRDRITREGRVALDLVATMARELGDALSAAHEAGVIHRDVKPENVMLSKHGTKLTDFGVARMPDSTLTHAGAAGSVLGTPAYSAPEALALGEFSPLSDQFSLAVTLYESISGARAFPGDDALAIASRIATEPPPPLPVSFGADPRVVTRLDQVLARGMSKEPNKRYPSCRELGDALAEAIEARLTLEMSRVVDTPVPRSIVPRATRRLQNYFAAGALIVIVTLLLVGRRESDAGGVSLRRVSSNFASVVAAHPALPQNGASIPPKRHAGALHDAGITGAADEPDATTPGPGSIPGSPPGSAAASDAASDTPPHDTVADSARD